MSGTSADKRRLDYVSTDQEALRSLGRLDGTNRRAPTPFTTQQELGATGCQRMQEGCLHVHGEAVNLCKDRPRKLNNSPETRRLRNTLPADCRPTSRHT
jgi:hypothetical protein